MALTTFHKVAAGIIVAGSLFLLKRRKSFETKIISFNGRNVLVHVPNTYASTRVLMYFHGNGATLDDVNALIPIFDSAKRPPIVVVPQLAPSGSPGDLASDGVAMTMLRSASSAISSPFNPATTQVDIMSHSGGYLAASAAMYYGQIPTVSNVGLLDSLYGNADIFERFARNVTRSRYFINIYGPSTAGQSVALASKLADADGVSDTYYNSAGSQGDMEDGSGIRQDYALVAALKHPVATIRTNAPHGLVPRRYVKALLNAFA